MKKFISAVLAAAMAICLMAGGGGAEKAKENASVNLKIVTTIFPEYDWVKSVLGDKADRAELTLLLDKGTDLHSYQPSANDIMKISSCDIFIYVGGESDKWVEDALKEATNKNMVTINLMEVLGDKIKEEEIVEGMQSEEEESEGEGEEEETEYDEHVWLSLKNTETVIHSISAALQKLDKDNADTYRTNATDYINKLKDLDKKYSDVVSAAKQKTLLFGDRFPFRYLTDDYGLKYFAAFVGCSAETEASFETITFLAKKADDLSLKSIMTIENSDHKIADTINSNTKAKNLKVLTLDSMQSTTSEDIKQGKNYLSVMEKNLEVLKEALQ